MNINGIHIEEFKYKDLNKILEIEKQTQDNNWNEKTFEFFMETFEHDFLVAKENNNIIGFILVTIERKITPDKCKIIKAGHIVNIAVEKNNQGKGIGYLLITTALKKLKEKNIKYVFLEVAKSNSTAIKLYYKLGFNIRGIRKRYYSNKEDALIMDKTL
ncbi:MAG: ribosomal protein S18-alanine N-acetyltransferase [Candidatus Odinarchaeia archaeon]